METATILRQEADKALASNAPANYAADYATALLDAADAGESEGWETALRRTEETAENGASVGTAYARGAAYASQIINETQ